MKFFFGGHETLAARFISAFILFVAITADRAVAGGPPLELEIAGAWGGPVNAVQVVGDVAYVGSGRRLVALNVADLADITEIGSIDLGSTVEDVAVRDGFAFATTQSGSPNGNGYLYVVNIKDATAMAVVDEDTNEFYQPGEINLYQDFAYVEDRIGGEIHTFDISNPHDIVYLSKGPWTGDEFAVNGDRMYRVRWVGGDAVLSIHDLASNPVTPPQISATPIAQTCSHPTSLFVTDTHAYITFEDGCTGVFDGAAPLVIVDVSNPAAPIVASRYYGFGFIPNDVVVADGYAYIADMTTTPDAVDTYKATAGLVVLDVTNPASPTLVSTFKTHGDVRGVRVFGSYAYLFDDGEGLIVLDIVDRRNPTRVGNYYSPATLGRMAKQGDLLFVTDVWNGFTILDASGTSGTPQVIGVYQTPPDPKGVSPGIDNWGIAVRDGIAYLAAGWAGVQIVDVSNPGNPVHVGGFPFGPDVKSVDLELDGDVLHVGTATASGDGYIVNFAISRSSPPQLAELDFVDVGDEAHAIKTSAGYSFVAQHYYMQTVDSTKPSDISVVGSAERWTENLDLDGQTLFIADSNHPSLSQRGLWIWDVSNPLVPVVKSHVTLSVGTAVGASSGRAFVVGIDSGGKVKTFLYDVTDRAAPVLLDSLLSVGNGVRSTVLAEPERAFVATGMRNGGNEHNQGLVFLNVTGLPDPSDLNGDGVVNGFDLAILLGAWGTCPKRGACAADLNGDGAVNGFDLAMLLGDWD